MSPCCRHDVALQTVEFPLKSKTLTPKNTVVILTNIPLRNEYVHTHEIPECFTPFQMPASPVEQ